MCEGCKEIIVGKKSIIRQAAFKNKNDFVEANELISIIHYKFFNWKRKQEGPIKVNNSFFHRIAFYFMFGTQTFYVIPDSVLYFIVFTFFK